MSRLKTALSLYVAIAAHLVLILLLFRSPAQLPQGMGKGIEANSASARADADPELADRPPIALPIRNAPDLLTLAAAPIAGAAAQAKPREQTARTFIEPSVPRPSVSPADSATGIGGGRGGYLSLVRQHLSRNRRALPGALTQASSTVAFVIDAQGAVSDLRLVDASGVDVLDAEALAMVRRAAPLPPPPDGLARTLVVPVFVEVGR